MTAFGLIEGRNADQAVDSNLAGQQTEGVLPIHGEGRGFQTCFFTRLVIVENGLEAAPFRPAKIHTQQHVGPVLRFGSARPGMNGHDRVAVPPAPGLMVTIALRPSFSPESRLSVSRRSTRLRSPSISRRRSASTFS